MEDASTDRDIVQLLDAAMVGVPDRLEEPRLIPESDPPAPDWRVEHGDADAAPYLAALDLVLTEARLRRQIEQPAATEPAA